MANNFRITGNSYVSKGGHDSNNGLTPDTPKKTATSTLPTPRVVGAGHYNVTGTFGATTANGDYFGDGKVILDWGGTNGAIAPNGNNYFYNFHFLNCNEFNLNRNRLIDCTIQNCGLIAVSTFLGWTRCKIINCTYVSGGVTIGQQLLKSILISTELVGTNNYVQDCFVDIASRIVITGTPTTPTNFKNNNVQGVVVLGGNKYAIQDQFTGTPQDNGYGADVYWLNEANLTANGYAGTIVGWDAAVATCINRDPKFNNASKLDFTLQADSPHIGRASDGFSNIGGTEYAQSFYAGISNPNILLFDVSEAIDTATNNNDWRLKPGYNEGWIRAIIKVSNNDVQISSIPYIGNYSFDSDQVGGSSTNMNVPDSKPITNEYPDYLTVTTQAANDTTLIITGHGAAVGDWLWVDGQYREITGVPDADTITFDTPIRAIVVVGTVVKIGTFESLASLNPNRLNLKMRSSKLADINASNWDNPLTWDNDGLAPAGQYMAQEWNNAPMIDSLNEVGFGDDKYDANYGNPINLKVVDIMIYLRNNYRS